ncbi:MAG TPA: hypothetical protein VLB76_19525 [Thermoanaerobaculia bacterium]|jgi:hypothetical protein|nr:hypothetical protein [Thermoanaerobaculia bacterium]
MPINTLKDLAEDIGKLIGAHVLAGTLGAGGGYCLRLLQDSRKARRVNASIKDFFGLKSAQVLIVHSAVLDASRQAYNLPSCDTRAARVIAHLLETAGRIEGKSFLILPEGDFTSRFGQLVDAADYDLVFLCGPKRNHLVSEVLLMAPHLRYQLSCSPETGDNVLFDRERNSQLVSSRDLSSEAATTAHVAYDFGLLLSMPSPLNMDRQLVILAGIHGTGTLGAAEYLSDPDNVRSLCRRRQHGIVQEVVRAEYKADPELIAKLVIV